MRFPFKRPSTRFFVALGLTSLLTSLLLLAVFADLVPDRTRAVREGRAGLAEALGASVSTFVTAADLARVKATLDFVVERNEDLLSAGIRRTDGKLVLAAGDHAAWTNGSADTSTDTQVRVPISSATGRWGTVELRFRPSEGSGLLAPMLDERLRLVGLVGIAAFLAFYLYLGKVLRQLDPSQAVPGRVRAAFDTMAESLLVADRHGQVVLANEAFAGIAGQSCDSLVGRSVASIPWCDPEGQPMDPLRLPWDDVLATGRSQRHVRLCLDDATGRRHSFLMNCSPVIAGGSKPAGVLISLDDVTELQEKEVALRIARDQAESANRAKSDFLANMSHEIRTPMNAILGFTDLIRRGYHKDGREMRRHLDTIRSSGQHLLDLINDILDLAKVESGRMEIETLRCSPHLVAQEVVHVLAIRAQEKHVGLRFSCRGRIPETALTDPSRLRQILTNLVGNAIKFTTQGEVVVVMSLADADERPTLRFDIRDTGAGIPRDRLEAIFEPFVQAESSTTRNFGGTGLGLTISRRFARALGGDIIVRSQPGRGSVFTVTLDAGPLDGVRLLDAAEATRSPPAAAVEDDDTWTFPPRRVLVADDGEPNRDYVRLVLQAAGLTVDEAANGRMAVDKALAEPYDAILMDMQMPELDGFEATKTLRGRGVHAPIVAMTAHAMKGFEEELMAIGCSGYITKPIDLDLLLGTLAPLLDGRKVRAEPPAELKKTPPAPLPIPAAGRLPGPEDSAATPVKSRLHDHPRLRVVARKFAEQMPARREAVEAAWRQRDYRTLADLAHWLKGSGGTAGFDVFTKPAKALEALAKERNEHDLEIVVSELLDMADRIVMPADEQGQTAQPVSA
ncbi:MAG: ATP-binding protein [Burkholderiales bacterium]